MDENWPALSLMPGDRVRVTCEGVVMPGDPAGPIVLQLVDGSQWKLDFMPACSKVEVIQP